MSEIAIVVHVLDQRDVPLKVNKTTTITEVCLQVIQELGQDIESAGDYGLLRKSEHGGFNLWLDAGASLGTLGIQEQETLCMRKRQRMLKIKLIDGSEKSIRTLMIDESQTLGAIVRHVCHRIGVQNFEEYSLVPEETDTVASAKLASVKRKKKETLSDVRARLNEEEKWLQHDLTLLEQNVRPDEVLVLRKKFFYTDQEIDRNDPVQVNLVYGQSKDAILKGQYPCTQDEAVTFAGMQMQIEFGNHNPDRHKVGFIDDLRSVLPLEYVKVKGIEKKIYAEHKKQQGVQELAVKYKYITMCRSLNTYGISFFKVKEKLKGKNKLVSTLLGITRESVMRMDEKTKEVLRTWPLTTVRRWVASPNSFTLDFGDYAEYYSVQTDEGDSISQLIAGYIDIILKKKRQADQREVEQFAESQVAMAEAAESKMATAEAVGPMRAQQMNARRNTAALGARPRLRTSAQGQLSLATHVSKAQESLQKAAASVTAPQPPQAEDDASSQSRVDQAAVAKQQVISSVAAIMVNCSSLLNISSKTDRGRSHLTGLGSAFTAISSNIVNAATNAARTAGLDDNQASAIVSASQEFVGAIAAVVEPYAANESGNVPAAPLEASIKIAATAAERLLSVLGSLEVTREQSERLNGLVRNVATGTAALVEQAKVVAGQCDDPTMQQHVIKAAKTVATSITQLAANGKILGPVLSDNVCQEQLCDLARGIAAEVERLLDISQSSCSNKPELQRLGTSASAVTASLAELINSVPEILGSGASTQFELACSAISDAAERLETVGANGPELVATTKTLAQAAAVVVGELKTRAAHETAPAAREVHLKNVERLAQGTSQMVAAAKLAAQNVRSKEARQALVDCALNIKSVTTEVAGNSLVQKSMRDLQGAAKQATAAASQLLSASEATMEMISSPATRQQLEEQLKSVRTPLSKTVAALRDVRENPGNTNAQLSLLTRARELIAPAQRFMAAAKSAAPAIEEPAAAAQLTACSRALGACLAELKSGVTEANDACQDLEIESAAFAVSQLSEYLTSVVDRSKTGRLRVSGSNNNNKHGALVNDAAKQLQASMSQLFTGIDQQDESYASACSRSVATAARGFAEHVTRYASTLESPADQQAVLSAAERAVTELASGLAVVRTAVGGDQPARTTLETQDKAFSARLGDVTAYLPGQLDIRRAMSSVQGAKVKLESKAPASAKPDVKKYTAMQHELTVAAEVFNQAAAKMARAPREGSKMALAPASQELATAHERVVQVGMSMMESCARPEDRSELMKKLMAMSNTTSGLLSQVGAAMANKDGQQAQLGSAMRNLTTCLNGLLETCSSAAPGQQECDTAERSLQAVLTGTEEALAPVSSLNYFQCFDEIMDASKELGSSLAALAAGAREQDMAKFGDALDAMTGSTSQLVRASTQAAYLMAVSDPTSTTGEQGLLDPLAVAQAAQAIDEAAVLLMSSSSTKPIASIARTVAASTTTLSNLCKLGATRASNKTLRTQLVDAARTVAQTTSALVQHIKRYAADPSDAHKMAAQEAFASLQDCARHLVTLSEMPEYASAAPQISEGAKRRQQPYLESGRAIAEAAIAVVRTARNLAANAKNTEQWQQLAANSKAVSEAIKRQAAVIKAHSPGQLECDNATYFLNEVTHDLNEAEYAAQQQGLAPIAENSLEGYQQDAITVTDDIGQAARAVAEAAIGSAQHLAQAALRLQNAFNPLVSAAMGVASHLGERSVQTTLLQQAKTIVEAGAELLNAARDSGGNPAASSQHKVVSLAAQNLRKCVKEFVFNLSQRNAEDAVVQGTMSTIQQAIESLAAGSAGTSATAAAASGDYVGQSFVEYQDAITTDTRKLAKHVQQLVGRVGSDPAALVTLVQDIKDCFVTMTEHTSGALVNISSEAVQSHLQKSVTELGGACARVIQAANDVRKSPESGDVKQELALASRECAKQVNSVVAALQAGSQGTQACLTAAAAVETQLADLETMALFATAGSVAAEGTESFREHQPPMLEAARGLVDRAKRLISSAASSQGDLADAAENCQSMYNDLVDKLKLSLDSLASAGPEAQVLLINAARDVGNSLADLLNSTRKASGRSADDPAMQALGHQTKHMANSVTALLRTVQTVENEQGRVTTALKAAQGAIETEASIKSDTIKAEEVDGAVDDLLQAGRPLTAAVTKLASATNSGNASDLTMAANVARNAMCNLLKQTRRSTAVGVAPATANSVMREAQRCASSLNEIFEVALELEGRPGDATEKERVRNATKEIADALTNLNTAAFSLKGSDDSTAGAQEPSVAAERELLSAASTIDAVTIKLARLEESIPVAAAAIDESAPVEEQVLHGTQAITAATATLVKAATAAQQELGNGGGDENSTAADLVAAAKLVAHATQELCDGANASMRGDLSQERLVAAAKSIAKSTAQLIMACKVKMPSNSGPMRRLQAAGSAVKKAAENLVRTVQAAPTDVEDSIQLDASRVHAMKQEIEAVEAIVKQERELEVAKRALAKIRANKYGKGSTKVDWAGSVRIK